ncbi:MAG: hypothetical protein ACK4K0_09750 [Flavobacteriales bacterium]
MLKYIILFLLPFTLPAQDELPPVREDFTPVTTLFSIEGGFKLPTPTANKSFKTITRGVSDFELMGKIKLHDRLYIGAGFKHLYVEIRDVALNDKADASTQFYNPRAEVTYRAPMGDKTFFKMSLAGGYNLIEHRSNYTSKTGADFIKQEALNLEPSMGIYLYGAENFAIGLTVAYNMVFEEFSPAMISRETLSGFSKLDYIGSYNFFATGFTFVVYLQKPKGTF